MTNYKMACEMYKLIYPNAEINTDTVNRLATEMEALRTLNRGILHGCIELMDKAIDEGKIRVEDFDKVRIIATWLK